MSQKISVVSTIGRAFYKLYWAVRDGVATHYWLKGGRGSLKSSFISLVIVLGVMRDKNANAVIYRKVDKTLRTSVLEQIQWAIEILGVAHKWDIRLSPLSAIYRPTGQRIVFKGADNPRKSKSIKFAKGYPRFIWYEEVDEFLGMKELRTINQSLMRGGPIFTVFYSYNPPQSRNNWVNFEVEKQGKRVDSMVHHSSYLEAPPEWLGEAFLIEANQLKKDDQMAYDHEYMGEVTGTGLEIFTKVTKKELTDSDIAGFDNIRRGLDWGFATDPLAYITMHYDSTRRKLYIFNEFFKVGVSDIEIAAHIEKENPLKQLITADNAEPKSIKALQEMGVVIKKARKGPDSVRFGIKWLQGLREIVIDENRCPHTAREFVNYEYELDQLGEPKAGYPDKNNHTIDAVRYACESEMRDTKAYIS